ncbi:MAG: phytanoyl-CoA dioxygenase family protein [Trebonia sp.]
MIKTEFVLNDQAGGYPARVVASTASPADVDRFVADGFLVHRGLLSGSQAADLAQAVLRLATREAGRPGSECAPGQSIYLRALLDKDPLFHPLLRLEPCLSLARTLLGPQVRMEVEARMNYPGTAGVAVPWHGHLPVIPDPLPPLFCYPHQIHVLIYLDHVGDTEGALCVLPGSHARPGLRIPFGNNSDRAGQVRLYFEPGDAVLLHANTWHRTVPSTAAAGSRRLLLVGYVPLWIRSDSQQCGVKPQRALTADLAANADTETRELLGGLQW